MKDFKLTDLEGIGPTKAKRLENSGITTPLDFVIRGAKEVSRITDITIGTSLKLVHDVKAQMAEDGLPIMVNSIGTLRELKKLQKKYTVGVEEIDRATRGGFETQSMYEFYGSEGAGKTQLTFSITASVMANKESTWFIDCEGTFSEERLEEICNNRDVEYDADLIQYDMITDSEDMLHLINTKALDVITNHNVKVIVIDGLVGLFRMLYHGRGELADRQDIIEQILIKFRNLAIYSNVCIIITNQVMSNPDPFGAKVVAVGGHVLGHSVKYIYAISKGMKNNRTLRLIKSPSQPQADYSFFINEEGVSDSESKAARVRKKKIDEAFVSSEGLVKKDLLIDDS
tara:strand:- start:499 stop:1527 length:1029 start_codon:yes stop_codon:yes gene_type:complete